MGVSHPSPEGSGKAEAVTAGVCLEAPLFITHTCQKSQCFEKGVVSFLEMRLYFIFFFF